MPGYRVTTALSGEPLACAMPGKAGRERPSLIRSIWARRCRCAKEMRLLTDVMKNASSQQQPTAEYGIMSITGSHFEQTFLCDRFLGIN